MSYIFVVGAPGSKWSAVARSIYFSPSINRTDHREENSYFHSGSNVNHIGAYFDPGMQYGQFFNEIENYDRETCEAEFNRPFTDPTGLKIIKSHVLSKKIPFLRQNWPDCPIVAVLRRDSDCLNWWLGAGGFDITYPRYDWYVGRMDEEIMLQNDGIRTANYDKFGVSPELLPDSVSLAHKLGIEPPPREYFRDFFIDDVYVTVL